MRMPSRPSNDLASGPGLMRVSRQVCDTLQLNRSASPISDLKVPAAAVVSAEQAQPNVLQQWVMPS